MARNYASPASDDPLASPGAILVVVAKTKGNRDEIDVWTGGNAQPCRGPNLVHRGRDREFESGSLQQRVRCEPASLGLALSLPLGHTAVESAEGKALLTKRFCSKGA